MAIRSALLICSKTNKDDFFGEFRHSKGLVYHQAVSSIQRINMPNEKSSAVNLEKLDYAALKQLLVDVAEKVATRRSNELKTLVNGWAQKASQNGLTVAEVIAEFRHYLPKARRPQDLVRGGKTAIKHYEIGVTYKNPNGDGTWIGGTRGRQPPWLRELFQNLLGDEQIVKQYQAIAVST
jgi:DNA-binding protein H-NS